MEAFAEGTGEAETGGSPVAPRSLISAGDSDAPLGTGGAGGMAAAGTGVGVVGGFAYGVGGRSNRISSLSLLLGGAGSARTDTGGAVISASQRGQRKRRPPWPGGIFTWPPQAGQGTRVGRFDEGMVIAAQLGKKKPVRTPLRTGV
ncbi:MAG: hypothetical protein JJ992_22885 [Planctomycetes bacterium]|nr:hypothetical protein [Planctomycetota bacterium]